MDDVSTGKASQLIISRILRINSLVLVVRASPEGKVEAPGAGSAGAEDASRKQGQRMTKEDLDEIRMLKEQAKRERQEAADR